MREGNESSIVDGLFCFLKIIFRKLYILETYPSILYLTLSIVTKKFSLNYGGGGKFRKEIRKGGKRNKRRREKERMGKRIGRTVYLRRRERARVVETNSKIDVGERTCNLYLGREVKLYNVGVTLKHRGEFKMLPYET